MVKGDQPLAATHAVGSAPWKECLNKALCHVHAMLLRDMRPPFVDNQRTPGSPTMARLRLYARATFLKWSQNVALAVFGEAVVHAFVTRATSFDLEFGGVVGRPLYLCGAAKVEDPGDTQASGINGLRLASVAPQEPSSASSMSAATFCKNVASMTPLVKFKDEGFSWRCAACTKAGVGAETSRRLIRLYPLVRTTAHALTPMRSPPITVALYPPPTDFEWRQRDSDCSSGSVTSKRAKGSCMAYTVEESRAIWLSSSSYTGLF